MNLTLDNRFKKYCYWVIVVLTFIIYGNGINNEYSLDDNIVVDREDSMIERGFKDIPKAFKNRYARDKKQNYDYRPITTASFAIEKQFFKRLPKSQTQNEKLKKDKLTQANVSHFINVLLYIITCVLLFQLLINILSDKNILFSFIITLLFLLHPIHTEVVDNIKSRDELLMLMFMLFAINSFFKFYKVESLKKYLYLFYSSLFIVLSVLSKKDGFAVFAVIPLLLYFKGYKLKKIMVAIGFLFFAFIIYKGLRIGFLTEKMVVRDVKFFENPLFYSTSIVDRITVGLYCSWFYLKMLIFPIDMSYYYGYNQIPMATWKNWEVWVAILFYVPVGVFGVIQFIKRKTIGLGIVLWFGLMLAVVNVLFPIVGIVADRFTYMFSFGFCIVIGTLLFKFFKIESKKDFVKIKLNNGFLLAISVIVVMYSGRTIARNPDWHDYLHTYKTDIESVPNSAKAHSLIANTLYSQVAKNRTNPENAQKINDIIFHYTRAIEIDSTYLTCLSNLGSAYIDMKADYQNGIYYCRKAIDIDPYYVEANFNLATGYGRSGILDSALKYYSKTIELEPQGQNFYNSFNSFLAKNHRIDKGIDRLKEVSNGVGNKKIIFMNIGNLYSLDQNTIDSSLVYFEAAYSYAPEDKQLLSHIIKLHNTRGNLEKVRYYSSFLSQ